MVLEQDKLDAKHKKRSNLFNWRGQFTPDFIEYLITHFSSPNDVILDPFSGSGTVLQEAALNDRNAIGLEINISAYYMSKFFELSNASKISPLKILDDFEQIVYSNLTGLGDRSTYISGGVYSESYANLLTFANRCRESVECESSRILLFNLLFFIEKEKKKNLKESVDRSMKVLKEGFLNLSNGRSSVQANLMDAREAFLLGDETVDLILTSPPYINVFNYHQNYRGIVESFGYDVLKIAQSEFGSNRKNRGNRFKTVIQYCLDMELAIKAFHSVLKKQKKMILIVGRESTVRSTKFLNGKMIIDIIQGVGGFADLTVFERDFTNKFGEKIIEDIIVVTKQHTIISECVGVEIALKHLNAAKKYCLPEVICDIDDAIENAELVKSSPLFKI